MSNITLSERALLPRKPVLPKTAVVLLNMGGPASLKSIRPFLFNLFNDSAIIRLPQPLRYLTARLISTLRSAKVRHAYAQMGGRSPLLEHTQAQARALEGALKEHGEAKVWIAMRYSDPRSYDVADEIRDWQPEQVVLLPLYPHFSTTTTQSSLRDWHDWTDDLLPKTKIIANYPDHPAFLAAHAELIRPVYEEAARYGRPRLIFSAHGLPLSVVTDGDPYPGDIARTVHGILRVLDVADIDYRVCYQSKVGPLPWLRPSLDETVEQADRDGVPVVIVPVAFVSEHIETLVELDIETREQAANVPFYGRVPALGCQPLYIDCLRELVCHV